MYMAASHEYLPERACQGRVSRYLEGIMVDPKAVEEELLKILRFGGLDKDNLATLVKIVAGFSEKGLTPIKVFPKGIPPVYEGLEIRSVAQANDVNRILGIVLAEAQVSSVRVFPYGIPAYDFAEIVVGLGPAPVTGAAASGAEAAE
jgi:hypothetical protein